MLAQVLGLGDLPADFRRLWTATLASNLADGITAITFALAAASLTADPTLVASVAVAAGIPPVVLALVAGVVADRVDRRRLMAGVQVLRIVVIAGLALTTLAGALSIPLLIIGAFLLSIGQTFYDTTAQAIVPMLAGPESLTRANSRLHAAETLTDTFLGPPLGGALAAIGFSIAWSGAALGYVVALAGLTLLRGGFRVERAAPPGPVLAEIGEGLRYLVGHRLQRTLTVMVGMGSFAASSVFAVFVLYAVAPGPMGLTEVGYGLLLTASGAGSIVASGFVERISGRFGIARTLVVAQALFAVTFIVPASTANVPAVAAAFVVSGVSLMLWNVTNVSLRQRFIPPGLYGRVHAGHRLVNRGAGLAGGVVGGVMGAAVGLPTVFWFAAAVTLLSCLGGLVVNDANVAAALAEGAADRAASRTRSA